MRFVGQLAATSAMCSRLEYLACASLTAEACHGGMICLVRRGQSGRIGARFPGSHRRERGTLVAPVPLVLAPSVVETSACHACGLIQRLPELAHAGAVLCARCNTTLRHVRQRSVELCGVLAALGLLLFAVALAQPLASVVMQGGRFATSNLLSGVRQFQSGAWLLAPAVVFTLLLLPLFKLMIVVAMAVAVRER